MIASIVAGALLVAALAFCAGVIAGILLVTSASDMQAVAEREAEGYSDGPPGGWKKSGGGVQ